MTLERIRALPRTDQENAFAWLTEHHEDALTSLLDRIALTRYSSTTDHEAALEEFDDLMWLAHEHVLEERRERLAESRRNPDYGEAV